MTRSQDIFTTLRALDVADEHIDPRSGRARLDLARILTSDPAGHLPQQGQPRSPRAAWRTARRLALLGGTVTAVAATVVVTLPSITGGDRAFATWRPTPRGMSAEARADAADKCRAAQRNGPGGDHLTELRDADVAIAERRGVWTTVVLATGRGFSAMCITDDSTRLFENWIGSIGTPTGYSTPGPRELVATDLGSGTMGAGHLSLAAGAAGSDVARVVYRSRSRGEVAATVSKGRFALWLPGDELESASKDGVEVAVTYRDGSAGTSRLRL